MHNQKGFVLLTVFFVVAILEIFSLAFFARHTVFVQATERNQNKMYAFNSAEAAIDNTIVQLRSNSNYSGTTAFTTFDAGVNTGGYTAQVCPPNCDGLTAPTDSDMRLIQAIGYAPGNTATAKAYESRTVTVYAELSTAPFNRAAYARSNLTLNGTPLVDSYDSSAGAYGGANRGADGDIATGNSSVNLIGTPTVNGDITPDVVLNCSPATATVASMGALNMNNGTYTLTAGTYHFDSISLSGSARIVATGPVTVYVSGAVSIAGNGVTTSDNTPVNFLLYATGTSNVNISGNGSFYGAVYAPSSSVTYTGNGDFYGAVIANNYTQSGTYSLHYDTQLTDVDAPCTQVEVKSWRENNLATA
jgi:hypothetical protein